MGHSFFNQNSPPPRLVRCNNEHRNHPAAPVVLERALSRTARSPGFAHAADTVDRREYASRKANLSALEEFLRSGAPGSTMARQQDVEEAARKDSKRRKRALGVFSRAGLKQLRQSTGQQQDETPLAQNVARNVAMRESKGGKEFKGGKTYFQIAVDSTEMLAWDRNNLDANVVNRRTKREGEHVESDQLAGWSGVTTKAIEEAATLPTVAPVRNTGDYDSGLSKEFPHAISGSGKPKPQRESETTTKGKDGRAAKMKMKHPMPRHDMEPHERDFATNGSAISSAVVPSYPKRSSSAIVASDRAPSATCVLDMPLDFRDAIKENGARTPASNSQLEDPIPASISSWPRAATPRTPQHSSQNSAEVKKSSSTDRQSKAPSVLSASGSIAESVQSDADPGVITNAQSVEFVRAQGAAGYYNGGPRKPPKPGPAPTRALPSLPEGHDGSPSRIGQPQNSSQNRISIEYAPRRSPIKVPPNPPIKGRYQYSPMKTAMPKPTAIFFERETVVQPRKPLSPSPEIIVQSKRTDVPEPCRGALFNDSSLTASERKQVKRARSTKALKMRDIDRARCRQESLRVASSNAIASKEETHEGTVILPAVSDAYSFRSFLPMNEQQVSRFSDLSSPTLHDQDPSRTTNGLSPIIIVAEQEPDLIINPACQPSHVSDFSKQRSAMKDADNIGTGEALDEKVTVPRLPSNSPDRETSLNGIIAGRRRTKRETCHPGRAAFPEQSHSPSITTTDLEAKLEARVAALEKKNGLLHRLFLAVLDNSPTFGPSNSDRSSATSSLFAMEAKVDALLTLVQENKRLSAEL
ncbi:hypothetical protein MMC07_004841 [Pseudocyphellaria aurata]|nr:hypothetical protein [Pseudocyphellaria aurata]